MGHVHPFSIMFFSVKMQTTKCKSVQWSSNNLSGKCWIWFRTEKADMEVALLSATCQLNPEWCKHRLEFRCTLGGLVSKCSLDSYLHPEALISYVIYVAYRPRVVRCWEKEERNLAHWQQRPNSCQKSRKSTTMLLRPDSRPPHHLDSMPWF